MVIFDAAVKRFGVADESTRRLVFGLTLAPIAITAAFGIWWTGSFSLDAGARPHKQPINQNPRLAVDLARFLLLVVTGLGLIGMMFLFGYRDLVLFFDRDFCHGLILSVHQPPSSGPRPSDFEVRYEFADESGAIHVGEDQVPPAHPPPMEGPIDVVYCRREPSISRIASQVSGTPIAGVILGISVLVANTVQFVRSRRGRIAAVNSAAPERVPSAPSSLAASANTSPQGS